MSKKNKTKMFKIILAVIALAICIGITVYLFPVVKNLSTLDGKLQFKQKVENSGFLGMLSLFGLEIAQIFLFIIPGEPIEILAGMCYGAIGGTIFIMLSAFIISTIILFLVRKLGTDFVYDFCDQKKVKKMMNSKLYKDPKKIELIMLLLFLIPGTPKDLLVYVAGLLPIKPSRFLLISTFARFPSVISSTLAGAQLLQGNIKMAIILYAIVILLTLIVILVFNRFDKEKVTKSAIKSVI